MEVAWAFTPISMLSVSTKEKAAAAMRWVVFMVRFSVNASSMIEVSTCTHCGVGAARRDANAVARTALAGDESAAPATLPRYFSATPVLD